MKRILIIGYGNLLREDDGVGRLAAERLAEELRDPRVTVMPCHQLNLEMVEPISQADCVLFIDAAAHGIPGVMSIVHVRPITVPPESFSHRLEPGVLLAASMALYGRTPEALALTISGERFDYGETLSPIMAEVLPLAVDRVRGMVESECRGDDRKQAGEAAHNNHPASEGGSSNASKPASDASSSRQPTAAD